MLSCVRTFALAAILAFSGACSESSTEPTPLAAPASVTVTSVSSTSARVSYAAVRGATSYTIERAPDATGGTFVAVGTSASTTFDDIGLAIGATYQYRVFASGGGRTSGASAVATGGGSAVGSSAKTISADITANRTLYADTVYTLSGFIHVANGATLTIQPGTRILGDYDKLGSSLFIMRGAKIQAVGTAALPIVFTSNRPATQRLPGDWGGLIIIGNALINRTGTTLIEGTGTDASNPSIDYAGGTNDADDSGELRYVRVEYAGFAPNDGNELNTFTLAALGSATKLSYLQSLNGLDDSFEFFGGKADASYLVSYESGDDHFDMSEGYQGRMQYLIAYQSRVLVPRTGAGNVSGDPQGIENDGCQGANCVGGQTSQPYTIPLIANFTLVGTGAGTSVDATAGGIGMMLRRGTGGYYANGILSRWPRAGISLRDANTNARITAGELLLKNILLTDTPTLFQATAGSNVQFTVDPAANGIEGSSATSASVFTLLPTAPNAAAEFDWSLSAASPARAGGTGAFTGAMATKGGTVVAGTAYRGAADPAATTKWWAGWTNYTRN